MKTPYGSFIKQLREARELSQASVAAVLEMSRPSYVALEKGTKELSLAEAVAVVSFFGITLDELLRMEVPNEAKYKAMLLAFLREAKRTDTPLKKTKLAKLLYLADFAWYHAHRQSMSGMTYRKLEFGPVADAYFALIEQLEERGELNITQVLREDYHMYVIEETRSSQKTKLSLLSKEEVQLIKTIWKKWKNADTNEIVSFTMRQVPYANAEPGAPLSYQEILKEDVAFIY